MHLKPSVNTKLFGMNNYFNQITTLYDNKKMPNKILLSGKKGLGKATLAYHVINYVLSINEDFKYDKEKLNINIDNKSYKLVQNQSHPNFYLFFLINEKKTIDISQIREMIQYTTKSSFNDKPRFILIDNIEHLNKNSVNALLKIVEEPNNGIFFILINNSERKILPTLKSRCLNFRINFSFIESVDITNSILNKNILEIINKDLINYYISPGEIIMLINLAQDNKINLLEYNLTQLLVLLINNGYYKKDNSFKNMIINFIELYFLNTYKLDNSKNTLLSFYHNFIYKIHNTEKFNLDYECLFMEFKSKLLNE